MDCALSLSVEIKPYLCLSFSKKANMAAFRSKGYCHPFPSEKRIMQRRSCIKLLLKRSGACKQENLQSAPPQSKHGGQKPAKPILLCRVTAPYLGHSPLETPSASGKQHVEPMHSFCSSNCRKRICWNELLRGGREASHLVLLQFYLKC